MMFAGDERCKGANLLVWKATDVPLHKPRELVQMWCQNGHVFTGYASENRWMQRSGIENHRAAGAEDDAADPFDIFRRFGHSRANDAGVDVLEEGEGGLHIASRQAVALERVNNEVQ